MTIATSRHGEQRSRARLGLSKKTVGLDSTKAWTNGHRRQDLSGSLRRYLDYLYKSNGTSREYIIYNGYLYIFDNQILVTVWVLPPRFRNSKQLRKHEE